MFSPLCEELTKEKKIVAIDYEDNMTAEVSHINKLLRPPIPAPRQSLCKATKPHTPSSSARRTSTPRSRRSAATDSSVTSPSSSVKRKNKDRKKAIRKLDYVIPIRNCDKNQGYQLCQHPLGSLVTFQSADDILARVEQCDVSSINGFLDSSSSEDEWDLGEDCGASRLCSNNDCVDLQAITDVDTARECLEKNPDERTEDDIEILLEFLQNLPVSLFNTAL